MRETEVSCYQDVPIIEDVEGNVYTHAEMNTDSILIAIDCELQRFNLELLSGDYGSNDHFFCIVRRRNNMGEDEFTSMLNKFTDEELEDELARRREPPLSLKDPNLGDLKSEAQQYLYDIKENGRPSKDAKQFIFECVMKTFYGPDIFSWINKWNIGE